MVPLTLRSTSFSSSERTRMLSSLRTSGVELGVVSIDGLPPAGCRGSTHLSQAVAPVIVPRPINLCKPATRHLPGGAATSPHARPFPVVPHFYLDVLDGDQVIQDLEGSTLPTATRPSLRRSQVHGTSLRMGSCRTRTCRDRSSASGMAR